MPFYTITSTVILSPRSCVVFLQRLPFSIPELVQISPCRSSDGMIYSGIAGHPLFEPMTSLLILALLQNGHFLEVMYFLFFAHLLSPLFFTFSFVPYFLLCTQSLDLSHSISLPLFVPPLPYISFLPW